MKIEATKNITDQQKKKQSITQNHRDCLFATTAMNEARQQTVQYFNIYFFAVRSVHILNSTDREESPCTFGSELSEI